MVHYNNNTVPLLPIFSSPNINKIKPMITNPIAVATIERKMVNKI